MNKKIDKTIIFATAAVAITAALSAYALNRVYNSMKELDKLEFDFGNDDGLASMLKRKDNQ